jgi:enamine deaminase RidA (YjgF/YER057c/UK114 family)
MPTCQAVSATPALKAVQLEGFSHDLNDLAVFDSIAVEHGAVGELVEHTNALFAQIEAVLQGVGMTKAHIIDVKTTFRNLGEDLAPWNQLYDEWMTGVDIIPAQTACQLLPCEVEIPPARIAVSITATTADKLRVSSSRAGGGKPAFMIPAKDANSPAQPMHLPWSNVIKAGDIAWVAGLLDVQNGDDIEMQVKGALSKIETALEEVGMIRTDIINSEILIPSDLSQSDADKIDELYLQVVSKHKFAIHRVARTCANAKVEITVIATKSSDVRVVDTPAL